jgi:SPW repeat-containing protein
MKRTVWMNGILGVWLVVAPFVLGYSASLTMTANDVIVGVLIVMCAWWILTSAEPTPTMAVGLGLCGLWLIVVPFLLAYAAWSLPMANDVAVGAVTLAITLAEAWIALAPPVKTA